MKVPNDIEPAQLEAVILQMNANDSTLINQTQEFLSKYLKNPNSVMGFLVQIQHSNHVYVRQMAAVLLKKKINTHWSKLDANTQTTLKQQLLERVVADPDRLVRRAVATLIATLSKTLLPMGEWTELFEFIHQLTQSNNEDHRELAMLLFLSLTECVGEYMPPHFQELKGLFLLALQDGSAKVRVMAMKASCRLLDYLAAEKSVLQFKELIRPMIEVLKHCLESGDETSAAEFLADFSELAESPLPVLGDAIPDLIHFLLQALMNENLELSTRDSISFVINKLAENKPKSIGKKGLVADIFKALLLIISRDNSSAGGMMTNRFGDEDEDDIEITPTQIAQRTLDIIALHVPPKYVMKTALDAASLCLGLPDASMRKAATIMLGVIAEGCCEQLKDKIDEILPHLYRCASDAEPLLREAACFALGQWAEHLQPEILDHYNTLLPVVFTLLDDSISSVQATSCYVLECFTENMSSETVVPYLDSLVKKLASLLASGNPHIQLMAISAMGSTAVGAEMSFQPYFIDIANMIKNFLNITDKKHFALRGRALECMGYLAIAVDKEVFRPVYMESMHCAIQGTQMDDMELADYSFAFFCNISKVYGSEFSQFLHVILPILINACNCEDGVSIKDRQDEAHSFQAFDSESDDDEENGDAEDGRNYVSVRTSMLDMKAGAVGAIEAIAENTGADFACYVPQVLTTLLDLADYFHETIRANVAAALGQLVLSILSANPLPTPWTKGQPSAMVPGPVTEVLEKVIPTCLELLEDCDPLVVIKSCESLSKITEAVGPSSMASHLDQLMQLVLNFLKEESFCQTTEEDDDEVMEGGSLIESVCDLAVSQAKVFGNAFDSYFQVVFPEILKFTKSIRPDKDRAMAYGVLAEICLELDVLNPSHMKDLLHTAMLALADESPLVQQNCTYCIGILVQNGGSEISANYLPILTSLRPLFDQTKEEYEPVVDNACAVLARMIIKSQESVPLEQVLPVMLSSLPLKSDLTENATVFKCLFGLVQQRNNVVMTNMSQLLRIFADVLKEDAETEVDLQQQVILCLRSLFNDFMEQMQQVLNTLPAEKKTLLMTRLS